MTKSYRNLFQGGKLIHRQKVLKWYTFTISFTTRNAGNPIKAREELSELIIMCQSCEHEIFRDFGDEYSA